MQSQYTTDPVDFARHWGQAITASYEAVVQLIFYVLFLAMFILATRLLRSNKISGGRYLVMVNSVMLIIGTIQVVLSFVRAGFALQIVRLEVEGRSLLWTSLICNYIYFIQGVLLVTNNALTDGLFTYRCYVVWGRSIYATILPIAMLTATTVAGYVLEVQIDYRFSEPRHNATIGFILSVATNFVLMTLTAGRIWWVGREVRTVLESSTRHYDTAVAMIVESGAIYSLCVVSYITAISFTTSPATTITNIIYSSLQQIINIVPTLILVRVGLKHGVESETEPESVVPAISFVPVPIMMRSLPSDVV